MCKHISIAAIVFIGSVFVSIFTATTSFADLKSGAMPAREKHKLTVCVSIPPQKFLADRIGGERVKVSVLVKPGTSPHMFEPRPSQMKTIAQTDIYIAAGIEFENIWLDRFVSTNPGMLIIRSYAGIEKRPIDRQGGFGRLMHKKGKDPHIWLSPPLLIIQARNIMRGFVKADPAGIDIYLKNYLQLVEELAKLDTKIAKRLHHLRNRAFITDHPAWGYFADAYGLVQVPIEHEGKEPKPSSIRSLIETAGKRRIRTIIINPMHPSKFTDTIAKAVSARVFPIDPLGYDIEKTILSAADAILESRGGRNGAKP